MKPIYSLLAGVIVLGLAGCNILPQAQVDVVRYFTLSSAANSPAQTEGTTVRPVQLAGHLRNRAMAVRVAENEVIYLEDVRWAESLSDAVTLMLRAKLGPLGGNSVVSVEVQRCELLRHEGNAVQVAATYTILTLGENSLPKRGVFSSSPRAWDGTDHGTLVNLLRDSVSELGDAIAAALPEKK